MSLPFVSAGSDSNAPWLETEADLMQFLDTLDVSAMKLGLDRIRKLLAHFGDPQDDLPMIHIAGTNGKGSVTAMLASVLQTAGLRTGAFISPHLVHLRERIALNGQPIPPEAFRNMVNQVRSQLLSLGWPREDWPTYFEFINTVAYLYFREAVVDVTVFETGLGGRLDSTNVVRQPNLTVITSIGMDHTRWLGDTPAKIAAEKAGILKVGTPVVLGAGMPAEARETILGVARNLGAPIIQAHPERLSIAADSSPETGLSVCEAGTNRTYRLALAGTYQMDNLAVVLACVEELRRQGFAISEAHLSQGLVRTVWPARFQYLAPERLLVDGSHNEDGFRSLTESLQRYFSTRPKVWLLSLRANREPELLLSLLEAFDPPVGVVVTRAEPAHLYHEPEVLAEGIRARFGEACPIRVADDPLAALDLLRDFLREEGADSPLGIVTGSLYTAGAVLSALHPADE